MMRFLFCCCLFAFDLCVTVAQNVLDLLSLCVSLPGIVSMSDNTFFLSYVEMARNREGSGACHFFLCTKQH